jgi:uncharacterized repeat protein (TIGR03803 family)
VILDSAGNLYGTTAYGGTDSCCRVPACGVVYKLGPAGEYTVLYSFTCGAAGGNPYAGVMPV